MSTDLFLAYAAEMPRLRAERLLDAAKATTAPHWDQERWDAVAMLAYGDDDGSSSEATPALFRLNGQPMQPREFKGALASRLGGGFADAAA